MEGGYAPDAMDMSWRMMGYVNMNYRKYNNQNQIVAGKKFASKKEARRYSELLLLEKAGKISDLRTQVKFVLVPTQREPDVIGPKGGITPGKMLEKEAAYIADFVYTENGVEIVEDSKGFRTDVYRLKRKLMRYFYGIAIRET